MGLSTRGRRKLGRRIGSPARACRRPMAHRAVAHRGHDRGLLRVHRAHRVRPRAARHARRAGAHPRHAPRRLGDRGLVAPHLGVRPMGQHALRRQARRDRRARAAAMMQAPATSIGATNTTAIVFFVLFIAITLGITYWAARRTQTTEHFYAAGRSISPGQNGLALAGDYMSAASFLGIAGLVSTTGFDGLISSTGWLAGWAVVLFVIGEPMSTPA